jgi:hypothetical protein
MVMALIKVESCLQKDVCSYRVSSILTQWQCSPIIGIRYLGHMVNNKYSDDDDIKREIRNLFMRTDILVRRYGKCSINVKLALFKAYCMCFYDACLWRHYSTIIFNKLR